MDNNDKARNIVTLNMSIKIPLEGSQHQQTSNFGQFISLTRKASMTYSIKTHHMSFASDHKFVMDRFVCLFCFVLYEDTRLKESIRKKEAVFHFQKS